MYQGQLTYNYIMEAKASLDPNEILFIFKLKLYRTKNRLVFITNIR